MNFCEETVKLNGSLPAVGHSVYSSSHTQFTSLLITGVSGGHSVAFVGTSNGELLQLRLPSIGSMHVRLQSELFRRLTIDPGQAILSDMALDAPQKHLFVASARKVISHSSIYTRFRHATQKQIKLNAHFVVLPLLIGIAQLVKVAIHHCPKEDSCNACLAARNPFCGWCSLERR
jgi:plexin A